MLVELTGNEKIILEIVRDYLDKNRQFVIEEIIPFVNSRLREIPLNLNNKGIKIILNSLVKKKYLVEGSKLSKTDILDNEKRRKIYDYILTNPGTYFNKIVSNLELSNHVVIWHLNMLLKFNFIQKIKIENHEIYYDLRTTTKHAIFQYYTKNKKSKRIVEYLEKVDLGITKTKLASTLNIHINTLSKYLNILERFHIIKIENIGDKNLYFLDSSS